MAAVIGLTFHSFAYLTKVYAESIEEIDDGTIEALRGQRRRVLADSFSGDRTCLLKPHGRMDIYEV